MPLNKKKEDPHIDMYEELQTPAPVKSNLAQYHLHHPHTIATAHAPAGSISPENSAGEILTPIVKKQNKDSEATAASVTSSSTSSSSSSSSSTSSASSACTATSQVHRPSPSSSVFPDQIPIHVGLFGVCTEETPQLSYPGPSVRFDPVIPEAQRCIQILKHGPTPDEDLQSDPSAQPTIIPSAPFHATKPNLAVTMKPIVPSDIIIGVTHQSYHQDQDLAMETGLDVALLLGGHDHLPFAFMENNTLIFKTGQNALWLGVVDIRFEVTLQAHDINNGVVTPSVTSTITNSQIIPAPAQHPSYTFTRTPTYTFSWHMLCNRGIPGDPYIESLIATQEKAMEEANKDENPNEVLAYILAPGEEIPAEFKVDNTSSSASSSGDPTKLPILSIENQLPALITTTSVVRNGPSSFADLVADAMCSHYRIDGADAAFINGGFVRGDKVYNSGTLLTVKDIRHELPFPKVCLLCRIRGKYIRQALTQHLMNYPTPAGSYPHCCSTVSVTFEASTPAVVKDVFIGGKPVEDEKEYKIAISTFMFSGGDGAKGWTHGVKISADAYPIAELVLKYLRKYKIVSPNHQIRIVKMDPPHNKSKDETEDNQ